VLEAIFAGLFGLLIGSFLNVCIYRMPRDLSVIAPRSFCPECNHQIAWFDNIPVATYLLLRGQCRRCGKRIPIRYPIVEFLTAALFFASVARLGPTLIAAKLCAFCAIQIALIFTDFEARILPDEFTIGGTILGLALAPFAYVDIGLGFGPPETATASLINAALAAFVTAGLLWSIGTLYKLVRHREGLGLGDVKMMAMVGAFVGPEGALLTLMLGAILGSVIGLLYIWVARESSTYELPFGSFLGFAAIVVAFLINTQTQ
jgi:leader peptidase (prepilin peptidase) / N-methyltransferase